MAAAGCPAAGLQHLVEQAHRPRALHSSRPRASSGRARFSWTAHLIRPPERREPRAGAAAGTEPRRANPAEVRRLRAAGAASSTHLVELAFSSPVAQFGCQLAPPRALGRRRTRARAPPSPPSERWRSNARRRRRLRLDRRARLRRHLRLRAALVRPRHAAATSPRRPRRCHAAQRAWAAPAATRAANAPSDDEATPDMDRAVAAASRAVTSAPPDAPRARFSVPLPVQPGDAQVGVVLPARQRVRHVPVEDAHGLQQLPSFSRCAVSITGPVTTLAMQRCAKSTPSRSSAVRDHRAEQRGPRLDRAGARAYEPAIPRVRHEKSLLPRARHHPNNGDRVPQQLDVGVQVQPTQAESQIFIKSPTMLQTFSPVVSNRLRPRRSTLCAGSSPRRCPRRPTAAAPSPTKPRSLCCARTETLHRRHLVAQPNLVRDQRKGVRRAPRGWCRTWTDPWMRGGTPRTEREQRAQSEQRDAGARLNTEGARGRLCRERPRRSALPRAPRRPDRTPGGTLCGVGG